MFDARRDAVDADNDALWMLLGALSLRQRVVTHLPTEPTPGLKRARLTLADQGEDRVLLAVLGAISLLSRVPPLAEAAAASPRLGAAAPATPTKGVVLSLRDTLR